MILEGTLIVAITCKDGVVFASDGQVTHLIGSELVKSKSEKIFRFGKQMLWGCSGGPSDITEFQNVLNKILGDTKNSPLSESQLSGYLEQFRSALIAKIERQTREAMNIPVSQPLSSGAIRCPEYLVVGYQEHPVIWQVANNCEPLFFGKAQYELTNCKMFAIGTGIGHQVARILFEMVKDVCSGYTVTQGRLIAYRIVKEATRRSAIVGEPIYVWTLRKGDPEPKCDADSEELQDLLDKWEEKERRVSKDFLSSLQ